MSGREFIGRSMSATSETASPPMEATIDQSLSVLKNESTRTRMLEKDPQNLIHTAKDLATDLRKLADEISLLPRIKGSDDLVRKLDEFLIEISQQESKILSCGKKNNVLVLMNLSNIITSLEDIRACFQDLSRSNSSLFILTSRKWTKKIQIVTQTFRSKCHQLMTSITLHILSTNEKDEIFYTLSSAMSYYYGIGRPKNHKEAFHQLLILSERDRNPEAMILLSDMYLQGYSFKGPDTSQARNWLEIAVVEFNHVEAKAKLGQLLLSTRDEVLVGDKQKGRDLLLEAGVKGHVEAMTTLGILAMDSEDYSRAFDW